MKKNYIVNSADELSAVLKQMEATYPDRIFITGVTTGGEVSAPNKRRSHYQHKLNHAFAAGCFSGNGISALMSGGGFYIAHVPKDMVNPDLIKNKSGDQEPGGEGKKS